MWLVHCTINSKKAINIVLQSGRMSMNNVHFAKECKSLAQVVDLVTCTDLSNSNIFVFVYWSAAYSSTLWKIPVYVA